MPKACGLIPIYLLMLSLSDLAIGADGAASRMLVPPSDDVAGLSQAEWTRAWWQWAESFEEYESPVADKTGRRCQLKQSGSVWFLAGTYGTHRTIRTCTVPADKYLFFPLINYVVTPSRPDTLTCAEAKDTAREMTDGVSSLLLELDGKILKNLESQRLATRECFDLAALIGGGVSPAAANGYYVMLRPLSRGTHTLNFGGILPGMSQAVTYTLRVE